MPCTSARVLCYLWKVQLIVNSETSAWNAAFQQCPQKVWSHPRCGSIPFFCSQKEWLLGLGSTCPNARGIISSSPLPHPPELNTCHSLPLAKAESGCWVTKPDPRLLVLLHCFLCVTRSLWVSVLNACAISSGNTVLLSYILKFLWKLLSFCYINSNIYLGTLCNWEWIGNNPHLFIKEKKVMD